MLIEFILGVALGVSALYAYFDSRRVLDRDLLKREKDFLMEEVKRLRIQVANMIGARLISTCCGDASHGCAATPSRVPPTLREAAPDVYSACAELQAERLKKAA